MPDPDPPETDEEEDDEEEDPPPSGGTSPEDDLDGTHSDAEVMLRMAVDLVSVLVDAKRVPQTLLDKLENNLEELVELMPD